MYLFIQQTGEYLRGRVRLYTGYSGFGPGKNNPNSQNLVGIGPIPRGAYLIGKEEEESDTHGPVAIHLIPLTGTETFGRSGFMIHGDSREHPGAASHGCIILDRSTREKVADGHDRLLIVLSGDELDSERDIQ